MRRFLVRTLFRTFALTIALVLYGLWITGAASAERPSGDAVVVHDGGDGERIEHALSLMDDDVAPTLVIMNGRSGPDAELCGRTSPFEVVCPDVIDGGTVGEAAALAELVSDRDWTTIVAVTSDYHLRRAAYLDQKCAGVTVIGSAADSGLAPPRYLGQVAKEMVALPQGALTSTVTEGC